MSEDEEVTVKLSLRAWRLVTALVEGGVYRDVQPILGDMYAQVNAQIFAARERAAAAAAQEIVAMNERIAADIAHISDQPAAEDASEPQLISQPPALH